MNYSVSLHTHTKRCKHAVGSEREYIERAIADGLSVIGFADHAPYEFTPPHISTFRMDASEADGYFETLLALREEYKGKIDIKIGFETEYYPKLFEGFIKKISRYPIDYLILGQHFLDNETTARYSGITTDSEDYLRDYVDQVSAGIDTGAFTYVAHPELLNFIGDGEIYDKHYSRLIEHAVKTDISLEVNLLGIRCGRHYPNERFLALCGKMGASVCVGADAHEPEFAMDRASFEKAAVLIRKYGVRYVESPTLRPVKLY